MRDERVDLAFLSEIVAEAGPSPVDQVRFLAQASGLPHHAFGENYSYGLPFYRIRAGNAVLSRLPLRAPQDGAGLQQWPGRTSLLDEAGDRPALLAGDFNAGLGRPPRRLLSESGRFLEPTDRAPTFPATAPTRRLDDIYAPAGWTLIEQRVVRTTLSDHLPVIAVYETRVE
jgi:endonuclease/exonuclease/phosphatase family metal-dependent hydrolase